MLDCWRPSKWLLLYTEQSRFWMPPTPEEPVDQGGRLRQEVVRIPRGAVRVAGEAAAGAAPMAPAATTGPVGAPVGDPPGGSIDAASRAAGPKRATRLALSDSVTGPCAEIRLTAMGRPRGGISQSSGFRPDCIGRGTAGTTIMRALPMPIVAVHPTWPLVSVIVAAMWGLGGAAGRCITRKIKAAQAAASSDRAPSVSQYHRRTFCQRPPAALSPLNSRAVARSVILCCDIQRQRHGG